MKARREAYAVYCDDSGGESDALRSVASVSAPARVAVALERELRKVLRVASLSELKWSKLRKREARLEAARAFLELAAVGAAAGALRLEILLWRPSQQGSAYRARAESERLRPLYARLWKRAALSWPPGRWNVVPDQRTGMRWGDLDPDVMEAWRRGGGGLQGLSEAPSHRSACVQMADLLAGLARVEGGEPEGKGAAAWRNRMALRAFFIRACRKRGLKLAEKGGLLWAQQRRLSVRLLRRLPAS